MIVKAKDIKLIIVDPIAELCTELEERFVGIDSVVIKNECIVNY